MEKFKIAVEETIVQEFEVEASDENEAFEKAIDGYKSGKIVLENPEVQHKQLAILQAKSSAEWREF